MPKRSQKPFTSNKNIPPNSIKKPKTTKLCLKHRNILNTVQRQLSSELNLFYLNK